MFDILHKPKITHSALPGIERYLDPAVKHGGNEVKAEVKDRSPGLMALSWGVEPLSGELAAVAVVSNHPGALPLDQGARWPGSMPPWGPGSELEGWAEERGLVPYLVARNLKRKGLKARHFALASLKAVREQVTQTVRTEGVQRWLKEASRG